MYPLCTGEKKKLRVRMINKDVRKSLAIKKGNEILIWSWNDSSLTGFIWDVYFRRHQYQLLLLTEYILGKVIIYSGPNVLYVLWNLLFESDFCVCYNSMFPSIFFTLRDKHCCMINPSLSIPISLTVLMFHMII